MGGNRIEVEKSVTLSSVARNEDMDPWLLALGYCLSIRDSFLNRNEA